MALATVPVTEIVAVPVVAFAAMEPAPVPVRDSSTNINAGNVTSVPPPAMALIAAATF